MVHRSCCSLLDELDAFTKSRWDDIEESVDDEEEAVVSMLVSEVAVAKAVVGRSIRRC